MPNTIVCSSGVADYYDDQTGEVFTLCATHLATFIAERGYTPTFDETTTEDVPCDDSERYAGRTNQYYSRLQHRWVDYGE